tara:strand:+ start:335 stop:1027 length:693 start_codon:yes stop_codon:yes gene_type:complete
MPVSEVSVFFDTQVRMPNGLQWFGDELFVMDQLTDDVFVLDEDGEIKRVISTETENGSGITYGGGFLWTACNGTASARPFRTHDDHVSKVRKIDPATGNTVDYFPTPDGGGIHGLEWDNGNIWLTAFNPRALILVDGETYEVIHKFPCDLNVLHGLALDGDGIWCSDRAEKVVVKYDKTTGEEIDRLDLPGDGPDPHGLSIKDGVLWYSDADFPAAEGMRGYPEIGAINR